MDISEAKTRDKDVGDLPMLNEEDKAEIQKRFEDLNKAVKLVLFTQKVAGSCQFCVETERLLKEVVELSDILELEVLNFITDTDAVQSYGVDKIPATIVQGTEDFGIRFYGIPTGYEFATLMETILQVSANDSGLPKQMKERLKNLNKPVHIQVFVTPTCPYCSGAAITAAKLAIEHQSITADIVEVTEFPQLAQKYAVMGVPKVVLNGDRSFEGAVNEQAFVEHVLEVT